ncbi:MAG: S1/P1 Nuclease [Chitinophagaceae bacterium]|nr:S1/P1 Nuclease [Chitinophagaceae bacterium]
MRRFFILLVILCLAETGFCWGFFAHKRINRYAIFLLPPEMLLFYKKNLVLIEEHAVDPDKRRYQVKEEGPRHYIDLDHYGRYPFLSLPRQWNDAVAACNEDSLYKYGIVPWWTQVMLNRLTEAMQKKEVFKMLKLSAELGHYVADAHVALHASSNHNGQLTGQQGIHGFWESRIPELMADEQWDFILGKGDYLKDPGRYIWNCVFQSAAAADTVLKAERWLSLQFAADKKFAFEERNGTVVRQYASSYTRSYDKLLKGMVERRMQESIKAVASFWITAWVQAGQPNLAELAEYPFSAEEKAAFDLLQKEWNNDRLAYICPDDHAQF